MQYTQQKGYSLTEIMIAIGVLAAITIGGLGFYSNAIVKAQASQSHTVGKLIADDVIEFFSRKGVFPDSGQNLAKNYSGVGHTYIQEAKWVKSTTGLAEGYVEVSFNAATVHQSIAAAKLYFLLGQTNNGSSVVYHGCTTTATQGAFDGSALPVAALSPIFPECTIAAVY